MPLTCIPQCAKLARVTSVANRSSCIPQGAVKLDEDRQSGIVKASITVNGPLGVVLSSWRRRIAARSRHTVQYRFRPRSTIASRSIELTRCPTGRRFRIQGKTCYGEPWTAQRFENMASRDCVLTGPSMSPSMGRRILGFQSIATFAVGLPCPARAGFGSRADTRMNRSLARLGSRAWVRISTTLLSALLLVANAHAAGAAVVVGNGTAASCTGAALNTALTGGGLVTFNIANGRASDGGTAATANSPTIPR